MGQIASAERGELVTMVGIINAIGAALPPVFVYPRLRNVETFLTGAPTGSRAFGNRSGWMTSEIFPELLKHLVQYTNASINNKILLMLDNHESHSSVASVKYCRDNGIVLLTFPPHCSHRLQPLDVGVYSPFKGKLSIRFNDWMISNPGRIITIHHIASLVQPAFLDSFTPKNIIKAFKKPGLWPLNTLAFNDEDFCQIYQTLNNNEPQNEPNLSGPSHSNNSLPTTKENDNELPGPSYEQREQTATREIISLEDMRPYPKVTQKQTKNKKSREGKSRILTDSVEKNRLEDLENERARKKKRQQEAKERAVVRQLFNRKQRISNFSESSESEISIVLDDSTDVESTDEPLLDKKEIDVDDFLLVKFRTNTTILHYIGRVLEKDGLTDFKMTFLRRKGCSGTFYYPTVKDIADIDMNDVVCKLPRPSSYGTNRTSSLIKFQFNFDDIKLG